MTKRTSKVVSRSMVALAMGSAITVGSVGIASASSFHARSLGGHDCASGPISRFDYARSVWADSSPQ